jgi:hypothetical protein
MVRPSCSPNTVSVHSKDGVVTKLKSAMDTEKFLVTIVWNPDRFHVVDPILDDAKFNMTCRAVEKLVTWE